MVRAVEGAAPAALARTSRDIGHAVGLPRLTSPPSRPEFEALIRSIVTSRGCRHVCEIGGGRSPTMQPETVNRLRLSYTVVDASPVELDAASDAYLKVHSLVEDMGGEDRFDLMFSRMVFEHVQDAEIAYRRVYQLLKRGGVCLNYHPTLFALPFVVNWLLPERAAQFLLSYAAPHRTSKFPAHYSWCRATRSTETRLRAIGFRDVAVVPLWGHNYYRSIPPIHALQVRVAHLCRERNWRLWASYALTVAIK